LSLPTSLISPTSYYYTSSLLVYTFYSYLLPRYYYCFCY